MKIRASLVIFSGFCIFISSEIFAADSLIAKYKQCVSEARAEMEKPKKIQAYRDNGCTTDNTSITGERDSCSKNVCWNSPPNTLIVAAEVWSHGGNGSSHSFDPVEYSPSREFATQICNKVRARSKSGNAAGRGWQKLSADVTVRRQITEAERDSIEAKCEKNILGG